MPSGAFTYYVATRIPDILRKYLQSKFSLTIKMVEFYMQIMSFPSCVTSLDGYWRHQINTLVRKAIDLMFQSSNIQEILIFDARIPREFHQDIWVAKTQQDFRSLSDRGAL